MSNNKKRILFLCTGNSCRSQMAEGFLRELFGERFDALSAGADPAGYVHPKAIEVMHDAGIDISQQKSKHINEFLPPCGSLPDIIISVCSNADENCPVFPADVERWQWLFDDPHHATGDDAQKMSEFRRVRDEIHNRLNQEFAGEWRHQ
ncbi:MAG: arsenate reductase ArsC [Fuerstiella sp.]|nr:arsenate reductase ArsC [Fuerstiella sp.]MCP4787401.1 arsenate reductase ArsC [Fuerstiella sp.]MCP4856617.1 arsenate reductase ArsC [Fuerstiella sp.]